MKVLQYLFVFVLQVFCFSVFSQKPRVQFIYLTTNENNLSQNTVSCMMKDSHGLMWFGTQEGLNKYDGYKFTVYKRKIKDPKSIIASDIYSIIEDKDGNIWIAAIAAGISMYDRESDSFVNFTEIKNDPLSLSSKQAYTIYEDRRGNIWAGTGSGLNLLNKKTKTFTRYFADAKDSLSLSSDWVLSLYEDKKGNFWVGTKSGLNLMNRETGKCRQYLHSPSDKRTIANNTVHKITEDSYGNLWIGTDSGLELFDRTTQTFTHFKSSYACSQGKGNDGIVYAITQDGNFLWIGSDNLSLFDINKKSYIDYIAQSNDNKNIPGKEIYSILLDDQNILWVGTSGDGIYKYEKNLSRFAGYKLDHENSSYNMIFSFAEDYKGNIWMGTYAGLSYFDRSAKMLSRVKDKGPAIQFVLQSHENKIWFGSSGRLDLFDPATGLYQHFSAGEGPAHLNNGDIKCLFEDSRGDTWIGTGSGANRWDNKKKQFSKYQHDPENIYSSGDFYIRAFCEDKPGNIWMGTWTSGIYVLNIGTNKFTHYNSSNSKLNGDIISTFLKDSKDNIWVGTLDGGFSRYNQQTKDFTSFTEEQGLINNVVNSIIEDEQGYLWVSTNKGLVRFDPVHENFKNYTTYNGLQSDEFNVGAGLRARNGDIFFGGINGFNVFNPATLRENKIIPPVIFTGFELFNKPVLTGTGNSLLKQPISVTKEITLSYNQSVFTFEFAALNYIFSDKNQYACKMEGFDKDWNYIGTQKNATYTNLDPGEYVFKVKASNNDGVWNEEGVSIKLIIKPPFWLTWWFKSALIFLVAGSIVVFYRYRMRNIKNQKKKLQRQVEKQTIQLVHANQELEQKNKELEQFAYIASHDLQEPLRTTSNFVELLRQHYNGSVDPKADKYFTFIGESAERMKILIKDLLDYSRIGREKELQVINCNKMLREVLADLGAAISETGTKIKTEQLPVVSGYPTEIKLLFQNLIINAIKFRKKNIAPQINISAQKTRDSWQFAIKDNGIGIEEKHNERIFVIFQRLHTRNEFAGSGIGLSHCKKIVELHKGKIWLESEPGKGTTFYFTLPAGQTGISQNYNL
jgi:signal transduction histidine kinase/ligand-binding sensor domain-containing protein